MKRCDVCGFAVEADRQRCTLCRSVADVIAMIDRPMLIVDGSFDEDGRGGAGLVIARGSLTGEVVVHTFAAFNAKTSVEAEYQAIVRGARWAPGLVVYSDCVGAVYRAKVSGHTARIIPHNLRQPGHALAHKLSTQGRKYTPTMELA